MKILCILQNAWGDRRLPIVFEPNPKNKSAKTIRKVTHPFDKICFSNTTGEVTASANIRALYDEAHFLRVIELSHKFDLILVCGKQAQKAVNEHLEKFVKPLIVMKHPAARDLSNQELKQISELINNLR